MEGSLTIVNDEPLLRPKRGRSEMLPDPIMQHLEEAGELGDPEGAHEMQDPALPIVEHSERAIQVFNSADQDEQEEEDAKPRHESTAEQVERLLTAKRRRHRLGRLTAQENLASDMEDVKKFLSLSKADREAFLVVYEFDDFKESVVSGCAKASSLVLRMALAKLVAPDNFDLVSVALDLPDTKNSLLTLWEMVDPEDYLDLRYIRALSAVGHLGDVLLTTGMNIFNSITKAAEIRQLQKDLELRRAFGVQSVFDVSNNDNSARAASAVDEQRASVERNAAPCDTGPIRTI